MPTELPLQKLPKSKKDKTWKEANVDFYETLSYTSATGMRTSMYRKAINYELFNGRFSRKDLEYVSNPLGLKDQEYPASLQHYDISSAAIMELMGEEIKRDDNFIVICEGPDAVNRKTKATQAKTLQALQQDLQGAIDPSTIDPKNPPPTPEQVVKNQRMTPSDMMEAKATKMLKVLRKKLYTDITFSKGFKDALIAGEEIYWTGIISGEPQLRRVNPLNVSIVLDGDSDYIDEALAVIEVRMLTVPSVLDEFGDQLEDKEIEELEKLAKSYIGMAQNTRGSFEIDTTGVVDTGIMNPGFGTIRRDSKFGLIRVVRVEWISMKKIGTLSYTDEEQGPLELVVDETFQFQKFKEIFPDAKIEWFWINEAWEGTKIGNTIYCDVKPKLNQRRRLDNPYYCKLGYTGLIYNATNSVSASLMDRMKPYQYLYNIIMYRMELAFASDMGKIFLMDLAQMPRSEGIDVEKWLYYLKAMKIGFVNNFEEGKGKFAGQRSLFNQFQSVDLSLANTIQHYVTTLDFIRAQMAALSGISPQRMGAIHSSESVGGVEKAISQSSYITEYWFRSHDEVKRRTYNALIEAAKIAYKKGLAVQYVEDDLGMDLLNIEEYEMENEELAVFFSNKTKDLNVAQTLKGLFEAALHSDKIKMSTIADTLINDSPREMMRALQDQEDQQAKSQEEATKAQQDHEKHIEQMSQDEKQKDRDLQQYKIDRDNETKIEVAEIAVYSRQDLSGEMANPVDLAAQDLEHQKLQSDNFHESQKHQRETEKLKSTKELEEKKIASKEKIEDKKAELAKQSEKTQITLKNKEMEMHKRDLIAKAKIEREKIAVDRAKIKADRNKPKSK